MTRDEALKRIYNFEKKAADAFALDGDITAFTAASEKVQRNLAGFSITVAEYAKYSAKRRSETRGFFTGRAKLPNVGDLDNIISQRAEQLRGPRNS